MKYYIKTNFHEKPVGIYRFNNTPENFAQEVWIAQDKSWEETKSLGDMLHEGEVFLFDASPEVAREHFPEAFFAEDVLAAADKIVADFGAHNTAAYFAGFSADASFMFYTHTERLDSRAAYEVLWAKWESEDGFKVHGCKSSNQLVQLIAADAAVFSHNVESSIEFGGEVSTVLERETIVFALIDGAWLAVHEHLSPANS